MRFLKSFIVFMVFFIPLPVIADSITYDLNVSNLERVGLKELENMGKVDFELGSYRLDPDFKLGYGDSVMVTLWGKIQSSYNLTIGRDGSVVIPLVGKVNLFGLNMEQAYNSVMNAIDNKYSNVNFDINLTDIKDIRIDILGNINSPGPYAVSPFCRVVEALAKSGGPNNYGSMIDIQVLRNDKVAAVFDVYNFLRKNDKSQNIRLEQGDTIYVGYTKKLVSVKGDIRYPGIYEIKKGNGLTDLLDLSGGMLPTKFKRSILIIRVNPNTKAREIFKEIVFLQNEGMHKGDNIVLEDDDTIIISTELKYIPKLEALYKTVSLKGKFVIPGDYLADDEATLSSLIKQAGGIKEDGFIKGAVYTKRVVQQTQKGILNRLINAQKRAILEEEAYITVSALTEEDRLLRQRAIDLKKRALDLMAARIPDGRVIIDIEDILKGKSDITLSDGDSIFVPAIPDWVLVSGAVYNPQSVLFKDGNELDYYIRVTGGLGNLADSENIYVIKADGSSESKYTGVGKISRGDIIIVPEKMN